jgi:thiopeptide-type bacteriocin biosynthesis protein
MPRRCFDYVLRRHLGPCLDALRDDGALDQWLFVPVADSRWHLRLRCHGEASLLHANALPTLAAVIEILLRDGTMSDCDWSAHHLDMRAYGGQEGAALADSLADTDTRMVMAMAPKLNRDNGIDRWLVYARATDALLADYGLDESERAMLITRLRDALPVSHARELREATARWIRGARRRGVDVLARALPVTDDVEREISLRSARNRRYMDELRSVASSGV